MKLTQFTAAFLIVTVVPCLQAAQVVQPGSLGHGTLTPMAAIEKDNPGWGERMYGFVDSPEGTIVRQIEADFNRPSYLEMNEYRMGATPLLDFMGSFQRYSVREQAIKEFGTKKGRKILAQQFVERTLPQIAEILLREACSHVDYYLPPYAIKDVAAGVVKYNLAAEAQLEKLSKTIDEIRHFRAAYGAQIESFGRDRLGDSRDGSISRLEKSYPKALAMQSELRLALAKRDIDRQDWAGGSK